jgi:23S rRNA (guanosine2251-2'-O)-methyltransferase
MSQIIVRQCVRKACSFRFPVSEDLQNADICPKCGTNTTIVAKYPQFNSKLNNCDSPGLHIEAFLDNLRSVYNVGSIFRSADGCGVKCIHLGGITPSPAHPRMAKTALGAGDHVRWEQHWDGVDAIKELKKKNFHIVGLEYTDASISIFDNQFNEPKQYMLVVGNENYGIDPGILAECNQVVHIPMAGTKESLNVAIAFSIAAYWMAFGVR